MTKEEQEVQQRSVAVSALMKFFKDVEENYPIKPLVSIRKNHSITGARCVALSNAKVFKGGKILRKLDEKLANEIFEASKDISKVYYKNKLDKEKGKKKGGSNKSAIRQDEIEKKRAIKRQSEFEPEPTNEEVRTEEKGNKLTERSSAFEAYVTAKLEANSKELKQMFTMLLGDLQAIKSHAFDTNEVLKPVVRFITEQKIKENSGLIQHKPLGG